jgi:hypothetical protein
MQVEVLILVRIFISPVRSPVRKRNVLKRLRTLEKAVIHRVLNRFLCNKPFGNVSAYLFRG